jgi:hypothetical protein
MKNQTNLDAIDTSWTWFANPHARWVGDIVELPNPELKPERVYQPLRDHTALFIEFSETPTTKTGILRFAQTYGVLDLGPEGGDRQKHIWVHAISEMKQAVTLWRAIESGKGVSTDIVEQWNMLQAGEATTLTRSELLDKCKERLRWITNRNLIMPGAHAQVVLTSNGDYQLTLRPRSLWGALWLQFAQAISHNYSIMICRGCGKPFQAGAGTSRRADATTCKDACRQMAFRKLKYRKKQ